ncbi:hypothetical protein IQ276_029690 [Desmonostoc muscorum LEGE 12446]|uniref:Uncharacterized protein n=1 Tax=Desmonostoc muscorum LEGE 12446 TaxID=1828758 RepID=A0A8J7AEY7_DESMC|nr:hypothetical protein [Desmonostoc muscorum]MCF2150524.1 hypothetical protein [Desmonostoc muscorum LEGE 12446]
MFVSPSLAANPDFTDNQPLHQNYLAMPVASPVVYAQYPETRTTIAKSVSAIAPD